MIVFSTLRQTVGGDGCTSKVEGVRGGNRRWRVEEWKLKKEEVWEERKKGGGTEGSGE